VLYSYLQECGFVHSAFTFVNESMQGRTALRSVDSTVPPGALLTFLQKGLQYVGIEEILNQENVSLTEGSRRSEGAALDFSLLSPASLTAITRPIPPIQLNVPPAAAAAAVKARLEAQARTEQEQRAKHLVANGSLDTTSQNSNNNSITLVAQTAGGDPNVALARQALAAQAAAAQAALAMSQLPQMGQRGLENALMIQQQQQQQAMAWMAGDNDGGLSGMSALSAAVAAKGGKRAAASGVKRISGKKQRKELKSEALGGKRPVSAFSSLENAVAQLEAKNKDETMQGAGVRAMEVDTNDDDQAVPQTETRRQEPAHAGQEAEKLHDQESMNGDNGLLADHRKGMNGERDHIKERTPGSSRPDAPEVDDSDTAAKPDEILNLEMHQSEVFMCAWNPVFTDLIATGSGDASARIWEMGGKYASNGLKTVKLLPHGSDTRDLKNKDVTTLEWSASGELLATGSYDGVARIWSRSGALLHTLRGHHGPIFSLKWNKRGSYLLSGSYDRTTIVWDVSDSTGSVVQQFTDHQAPALDVDWKDDITFASCSTDKTVQVCQVGVVKPLKVYVGHTDEVNGVKWDPTGRYLASCSDDCTAKVWEVSSDRSGPLYDFNFHKEEIYTLKWSPNTDKRPLLATASFDGTVMLWNIEDGSRFRVFDRHRDSVYSVAFSPSGDYLASGSLAGQMYIWDIEEGRQVKSYKGKGDIFEVAWNKEETRVAGCFSSNVVAVVDFHRSKLQLAPGPFCLP
jgi:transducin (beta)-like 1